MSSKSASKLDELRDAAAQNPDAANAHLRLGTELVRCGLLPQGEAELQRALELDPKLAGAWINMGGLHLSRWRFAECVEANARAIELEPDLLIAHFNKGLGHLYLNQADEMVACFERVLKLKAHHPAGHYYLAVGLFALGKVAQAKWHLDSATSCGHSPQPGFVKAVQRALEKGTGGDLTTLELGPGPKRTEN
jgi:tetratricopeptide (TPR) repeat protein